jgi:hypothetical protein
MEYPLSYPKFDADIEHFNSGHSVCFEDNIDCILALENAPETLRRQKM